MSLRTPTHVAALAVLAALAPVALAGAGPSGTGEAARVAPQDRQLVSASTGPRAELVKTVPIGRRPSARPRSVLSLALPRLRPGDTIRFRGEVTATTTCVEPLPRCIGRTIRSFDGRSTRAGGSPPRAWARLGNERITTFA